MAARPPQKFDLADAHKEREDLAALLRSDGWKRFHKMLVDTYSELDQRLDDQTDPVQLARAAAARVQVKSILAWPTMQTDALTTQILHHSKE